MESSASWETDRSSASQEIPRNLWNLKVHYHVHKHLTPDPIPNQSNQVHASPSHFFKINFTIIYPSMPNLPTCLFTSGLPHQNPVCISPVSNKCCMPRPSHSWFNHPNIIFAEEYRAYGCSLCSLLHSPTTSSLLGENIFFNALFLNTLNLYSFLNVRNQVSHPYKTTGRNTVLCILWSKVKCQLDATR